MFIIDLHYIVPLEHIDAQMKPHMAFLKKHYASGDFIMSGRKVPRTGGVILAAAKSKAEAERIIQDDPFVRLRLAEYTIIEFQTSQVHPALKVALAELTK
jgi:uncharacterized protein YciI